MSRAHSRIPLLLILLFAVPFAATAQQPSARPPSDSPGIYISHAQLAAALQAASAKRKEFAEAAIGVTDQYAIHEVHRGKRSGPPLVHHGWTELHFILSGGGTLVTGGKIEVQPGKPQGVIVGGTSHRVHKGDAIIVPPETPHWYSEVDSGGLTYLEVRFATPVGPHH